MSLLAVFMYPCANKDLLNHNHTSAKKSVLKAELNKTEYWLLSCNVIKYTHMRLVRDARSLVTGAPISSTQSMNFNTTIVNVGIITILLSMKFL
jgi:hypothetical protein